MSVRESRRHAVLERAADHLLAEGLAGASLRPLAAAVGTSDRMLLYYFSDKDELLTATLERVAARLGAALDLALPPDADLPSPELLARVWEAMRSPALSPYMRLWLELAAGAGRGQDPQRAVAGRIADGFREWVASRLRASTPGERAGASALLLATVEGLALLDAVGRPDLADAAVAAATAPEGVVTPGTHATSAGPARR